LFIAFCFEYLNYYNSLFNQDLHFVTHLPIQLDATCNGFQHIAFLTGDLKLGKELNIENIDNSDNQEPKDFYQYIIISLKTYFKKKILEIENTTDLVEEDKIDILNSYRRLLMFDISRDIVKPVIMTKPYNVTNFEMINYIKKNLFIIKEKYNNSSSPLEREFQNEQNSEINIKDNLDLSNNITISTNTEIDKDIKIIDYIPNEKSNTIKKKYKENKNIKDKTKSESKNQDIYVN
jgi:DNA-directed RNA polymerase